jgi:uncharacterized DUF497 family protein
MEYEWDHAKAATNLRKHGVAFADAALALEDPLGRTMPDPDAVGESRFICMGADPAGRVLITVFTPLGTTNRIISSRKASRAERRTYETKP